MYGFLCIQQAFLLWICRMQNKFLIWKEVTENARHKKMEEHFQSLKSDEAEGVTHYTDNDYE
jgi:hypothetical protein